jgi:hypothetical protein
MSARLALAAALIALAIAAPGATARTLRVGAGGDLQRALDTARGGDQIVLARSARFVGPFTLPGKRGRRWITVRGERWPVRGRGAGRRAGPAHAAALPDLVSPGRGEPALRTAPGAHHWRLIGLELRKGAPQDVVYDLVALGGTGAEQDRLAEVPHDLVLDRVWVHGDPTGELKRGIALNSARTRIVNSTVSDVGVRGQDSQAIGGWNGPGPFTIANDRLQGAAENVMFGGATPSIPGLVPSNIVVRANLIDKPLQWKASHRYTVKNLLELKNARRVRIVDNVFAHNWLDGQTGIAIVLTPRGENGAAPWAVVRDVRFERNVVDDAPGGVAILGHDDSGPSRLTRNVTLAGNLFTHLGSEPLLKISGATDVRFDHNTSLQAGSVIVAYGEPTRRFAFTNSIARHNRYGVFGDSVGTGRPALRAFFPGARFAGNVLVGGDRTLYDGRNFFPPTLAAVGFVGRGPARWALRVTSPYRGRATDHRDPGADIRAVSAAAARLKVS